MSKYEIIKKECVDCKLTLSPDKFVHTTTTNKNNLQLSDQCNRCRIDEAWNRARTNFVRQRQMPRQDWNMKQEDCIDADGNIRIFSGETAGYNAHEKVCFHGVRIDTVCFKCCKKLSEHFEKVIENKKG